MNITIRGNIDSLTVSRFQAKAALLNTGLLDQVEAAVANADPLTQLAWAEALGFERQSPAIIGIAQALGWTSDQLDGLFAQAARIKA